MSEKSATSPETTSTKPVKSATRARRVSNPRPKKKAKAGTMPDEKQDAVDDSATRVAAAAAGFPEFPESAEPHGVVEAPSSSSHGDQPEPAVVSSSASEEGPKRKRRRKKGKGNGAQNALVQTEGESPEHVPGEDTAESPAPLAQVQAPRPKPQPRPKLDGEMLAKCAWKIYLAEISEEGVALVGDSDAKELSRRCFRLAEIFMEEQSRRS